MTITSIQSPFGHRQVHHVVVRLTGAMTDTTGDPPADAPNLAPSLEINVKHQTTLNGTE